MNILAEYKQFQKQTEINDNFSLQYMAIGLGGETGEILNEIKKIERDDNNTITDTRKNNLILELGDLLWYFQGIASRLDISIEDIMKYNIDKISKKS